MNYELHRSDIWEVEFSNLSVPPFVAKTCEIIERHKTRNQAKVGLTMVAKRNAACFSVAIYVVEKYSPPPFFCKSLPKEKG